MFREIGQAKTPTNDAEYWQAYWKALALLEQEYDRTVTPAEAEYEQLKNKAHSKYKRVYDAALKHYQEATLSADADTARAAFERYRITSESAWKAYARVAYGEPHFRYQQTQERALAALIQAKKLLHQQFFATSEDTDAVNYP